MILIWCVTNEVRAQQKIINAATLQKKEDVALSRPGPGQSSTGNLTPGGYLDYVFDAMGNKYSLGQIAIDDKIRKVYSNDNVISSNADQTIKEITPVMSFMPIASSSDDAGCDPGYFRMFFETGCGMDDDTDPEQIARRRVLCQVLHDISQLIQSPLTGGTQKVNLWVRSQVTNPAIGGYASPFYNVPYSTATGVADNAMWITINSGRDAFQNIGSPITTWGGAGGTGSIFFHGSICFNFTPSVHWHTDLSTPPGIGESDLYSVALHEMLHALGFTSLIDFNGKSILDNTSPAADNTHRYYSRYDTHLQTHANEPLLTHTPGCTNMYDWVFSTAIPRAATLAPGTSGICVDPPSDITVCDNAVKYVNGAFEQAVYTPSCFRFGSSLCHFEDRCLPAGHAFLLAHPGLNSNDQYYSISNSGPSTSYAYDPVIAPGRMKRSPTEEEKNVLCQIGYLVNDVFGVAPPGGIGDGPLHNYHNYGGGVCGQQIAGINDGINDDNTYRFMSTGGTVRINGPLAGLPTANLLGNDHGAVSFKCLQPVTGGAVDVDNGTAGTNVIYTPAPGAFGIQLLRYIPVGPGGEEGNITYVYVYVGDSHCPSTCNLVPNGSFEDVGTLSGGIIDGVVHCWGRHVGTSDLFSRGLVGYGIPENGGMFTPHSESYNGTDDHFVSCISAITAGGYQTESIKTTLTSSMNPGSSYTISFWAKLGNSGGLSTQPMHMQFGISHNITVPTLGDYVAGFPTAGGLMPLCNFVITQPDHEWHYYTQTIEYPLAYPTGNCLIFIPATWLETLPFATHYVAVDNIKIVPTAATSTFTLPAMMCATSGTINMTPAVGIPGGTFSWPTTPIVGGVPTISHSAIFNPQAAYNASIAMGGTGVVTICYDFNDGLHCNNQVCTTVRINPAGFTVNTVPNPVCAGNEVHFTCVGGAPTAVYNWDGDVTCAAPCNIATASPEIATTYTVTETTTGCPVYVTVTVNPISINGFLAVCEGTTTNLSSFTPGGVWASSNPGVATINAAGLVAGIMAGTTTITYHLPSGCTRTATLTVFHDLDPITGVTDVCQSLTTLLTNSAGAGTWTTSNPDIATINATGLVTGIAPGTAIITFGVAYGCSKTVIVTVHPIPAPITGTLHVCQGALTPLASATTGGAWTSSDPGTAIITPVSGVVTGLLAGTTTISYSVAVGCSRTAIFTVYQAPTAITGALSVCQGLTTALLSGPAGGTWTSSAGLIAAVNSSGIVTGSTPGTTTITYELPGSCSTTADVTVLPLPASISGSSTICSGSTTVLTSATTGGTWSSSNPGVAGIVPGSGLMTGGVAGTATITYMLATGCYKTAAINVNPLPSTITGLTHVCVGAGIALSDASGGGTWSSGSPLIASVGAVGNVNGLVAGSANITYTLSTGCFVTAPVVVDPLPAAISGPSHVCAGSTIALTDATGTGTWSGSDDGIASINATTGILTGVAAGTMTVTYKLSTGCYTTTTRVVDPLPATIGGNLWLCIGATSALTNVTPGGTWSSSNIAVATIGVSGVVTAIASGTSIITYKLATGCYKTAVVNVSTTPPPITGPSSVCASATVALSNAMPGGTWSSSLTSIATIGLTSGVATGELGGTTYISYSVPGCTFPSYVYFTVYSLPYASGSVNICGVGTGTTLYSSVTTGVWSASDPTIAGITSSGIASGSAYCNVTAMSYGTSYITYTNPGTGCYGVAAINVLSLPDVSGSLTACAGATAVLSSTTAGGTWSSSNPAVATINAATGVVTGVATGTTSITYLAPTGCKKIVTFTVPLSGNPILGLFYLCPGSTDLYINTVPGGTWSSSNPAVATTGLPTSLVTAISPGTATISYTMSSGCVRTAMVTVFPPAAPITGTLAVCQGSTTALSSATTGGGTWSIPPLMPTIATIGVSTGILTGVAPGTAVVTFTSPTYCYSYATIIVNPLPSTISGPTMFCIGAPPMPLSDFTPGGTWSSGTPAVATINSATGYVTGVTSGSSVMTYTLPTGCYRTYSINVHAAPLPITGVPWACVGGASALSEAIPGGSWTSSSLSVANISASGIVTGLSAGTSVIYYYYPSGCMVSTLFTVGTSPAPITGPATVCVGSTVALSSLMAGGTWSSSLPSVGPVGLTTGIVTGSSPGTPIISYSVPGCPMPAWTYVTVLANPVITGVTSICGILSTTVLSAPGYTGGTWSTGNASVATVSAAGVVTGISYGTATISYTSTMGCIGMMGVIVAPVTAPITGTASVCQGLSTVLADATTGGSWSSSDASVASVSATGVVTGISAGSAIISFATAPGCYSTIIYTVTPPAATISGALSLCSPGAASTLSGSPSGGFWSATSPGIIVSGGIVTPTAVTGTATVTYTVGSSCPALAIVTVNTATSGCHPCAVLAGRPYTVLGESGYVTTSLTAGNYYIPNDVTVVSSGPSVSFTNAVVFVAPNKTIFVDAHSSLTSNGSHFLSCPGSMWKGIVLRSDYSLPIAVTAMVTLQGNAGASGVSTLIEDALSGVNVANPGHPNMPGGYIVSSINTIFNRNNYGIMIRDWTTPSSTLPGDPYRYEVQIQNTVFTSRNLAVSGYPFLWPGMYGTGGLKLGTSTSGYTLPHNVVSYALMPCHNSSQAITGVALYQIGTGTDPNYAKVVVGTPDDGGASKFNLFDGMAYGIYCFNANVTSSNNTFGNMKPAIPSLGPAADATGIFTTMYDAHKYQLIVEKNLVSLPGGGIVTSLNSFFDCKYGVYSAGYYRIKGDGSFMIGSQTYPANGYERFGYLLNSGAYEDISINNNQIYNIANGISHTTVPGSYGYVPASGPSAGSVNMNNNIIYAAYGGAAPSTQYISHAIVVKNAVTGTLPLVAGTVNTNGNSIFDTYRGILIENYWQQKAYSLGNNITVRRESIGTKKCWGINHTHCDQSVVKDNTINGSAADPNGSLSDSVRAYLSEANSSLWITCNKAAGTGRGFEIRSSNPGTRWKENEMNTNLNGLVLNYGYMGIQGGVSNPFDNSWQNPSGSWWNTALNHNQTSVIGSPAAYSSTLFVRASIPAKPTQNAGSLIQRYSDSPPLGTPVSLVSTPGSRFALSDCQVIRRNDVISDARKDGFLPLITDEITYAVDASSRKWIGQYLTWEAINIDPSLTAPGDLLDDFNVRMVYSRYSYLTDVENILSTGDIAMAAIKINTPPIPLPPAMAYDPGTGISIIDDASVDFIIETYRSYYKLYLNYLQNTMDASDSANVGYIANLCPLKYGPVVYKARSLHTAIFNEVRVWDEVCDEDPVQQGGGGAATGESGGGQANGFGKPGRNVATNTDGEQQRYDLFPNPSDGDITIMQMIDDKNPVTIEIKDMVGRSVYKDNVSFAGQNKKVALKQLLPGLYSIRLIDGQGREFHLKFVRE